MQAIDTPLLQGVLRGEQMSLQQYLGILNRHKGWIVAVTLLVTLAAALIVLGMQPIYRATTTVMIESKQANVVSIQDVYGADTESQAYYDTQFEIVRSRQLARRVVEDLALSPKPQRPGDQLRERVVSYFPMLAAWLPAPEPDPQVRDVGADVAAYMANLTVTPVPKTQLVRISFDSPDAEQAALVANRHAESFILNNLDARHEIGDRAKVWMRQRLSELSANLEASERKLQQFKEQEGLVDIAGIQTLSAQTLGEMSTNLATLRRELAASRNTYQQVGRARPSGLDALLSVPAIKSDPLVQQFKQTRAGVQVKVAELARRYGPMHPKMIAANSELEAAERELKHHVDSVVAALGNEFEVNTAQVETLSSAVGEARDDVHSIGRKDAQFRILQREVDTNRELYDLFYNRLRETAETNDMASTIARVIDPAVPPAEPARPRVRLAISMAFALTLIGTLLCAFAYEMLSGKIKHPGEVESKLHLPLLGYLPRIRHSRRRLPVARRFLASLSGSGRRKRSDAGEQTFVEMVRSIRTSIQLSGLNERRKVLMVTSSLSGEGKTTVACNLALALAQMERVLLIDVDLRRPAIAREFGVEQGAPGLVQLLQGSGDIDACIHTDENGLALLPAGSVPQQPLELLGSERFKALLSALSRRYDRIVLDCPPLLPVSDAQLVARHADGLIFVVKACATGSGRIRAALKLLERARPSITGVVLNQLDVKRAAQYGDYGSVGYYEAYQADRTS